MNDGRQLGREIACGKRDRHVVRDVGLLQPLERQLTSQAVHHQILLERLERTVGHDDVRRTVCADHEQSGRFSPPGDRGDDVERRVIGPVEILEDEHDGGCGGHDFERLAEFTHHTFARGAENLPLERGLLVASDEGRELNHPRRRVRLQRVHDLRAAWSTRELPDRFEHRVIGFFAAEALDRLTACHAQTWNAKGGLPKDIHQTRLPNPGFADHKHHLPATVERAR